MSPNAMCVKQPALMTVHESIKTSDKSFVAAVNSLPLLHFSVIYSIWSFGISEVIWIYLKIEYPLPRSRKKCFTSRHITIH